MTKLGFGWAATAAVFAACLTACSSAGGGSPPAPEDAGPGGTFFDRVIYYDGGGLAPVDDDAQAQPVPISALTSYSMDFGTVPCGTPPSAQTLTILNNGAATLTVTAMTTGPVFSVGPSMLSIPVGQTDSLQVAASVPGSAMGGTRISGSLIVTTNDPAARLFSVPLTVTPAGATLALSPAVNTFAFPTSDIGETTFEYVTLANNGNGPATFTLEQPSNPAFALLTALSDGGVTLQGGDTWTGKLGFTAADTTKATATCALDVTGTTCAGSLTSFAISGQGAYGQIAGWPTAPVDFGLAACGGAPPAPQFFTLSNTGMVDVRIAGVSIVPANSGFSADKGLVGQYIPAHQGRTIHVFAPGVPSPSPLTPISATLNIQTDADSTAHSITLQEEPQGAVLAFDTSATQGFGSFGPVPLLLSATQTFSVTNTGNGPADVVLSTNAPDGGDDAGEGGPPDDGALGSDANPALEGGVEGGPDATAEAGAADATLDADGAPEEDAADAAGDAGSQIDSGPPPIFGIAVTSFSLGANGMPQSDAVTFVPATGASYVDAIHMNTASPLCSPVPAPLPLSGVGFGGGIAIAPTTLLFLATCGVGSPGTELITVTNSGPADLTWYLGPVTGPGAAQYTLSATPGLLSPGANATIEVTAAGVPSPAPNPDPSALAAQFTVTTDIPNDAPHVIDLAETPIGDILSISSSTLRFGTYPIDFQSPAQTFTVTNSANAGSAAANLTFALSGSAGSLYIEPEDGGAFCVLADGGGDGGAFCPVADAGVADASDSGCPDAGAEGGCPPRPEFVQAGYTFAPLSAFNLASGGGTSHPFTVTFVPTTPTSYPATIAIQTSDPTCSAMPGPIQLSGAGGQGQVSLSAATLTFGTDPTDPKGLVNCGATGLPQQLTVSNPGTQPFDITALTLGLGPSSPYVLSGAGTMLPSTVPVRGSIAITITPSAIPARVANPNDPSPFTDVLTLTTDAAFDSPHTVSLVMQARGAVIANRPLSTTWDFGTISVGSIGSIASSIQNTGNAPAAVSLDGLAYPSIFGLLNNPTTVPADGSAAFMAQFTPAAANQSYGDQGTLVVITPQVFCEALPAAWNMPTIHLKGASSSNPPITWSGSLSFPSYECGSAPPAGRSIRLSNATNQTYGYSASFTSGAFYTVSPSSGTVPANGTASIAVVPKAIVPGQGVQTGASAYADNLNVQTFPSSAGDAATGPTAPNFSIPVSWTVMGAVLSLPLRAGPKTDGAGNAFYPADSASAFTLPIANGGQESATVAITLQPAGVVTLSPGASQSVAPGSNPGPTLTSTSSDAACPATTSTTATFSYSGPVCQPLALQSVVIEACAGTFP